MSAHLSGWTLQRLHAGELSGPEAQEARAHAAECAQCQGVLKRLEGDQARFEAEIPFERFAAGVERAAGRRVSTARPGRTAAWVAVAAAVLLVIAVRPLLSGPE